MKYYLEYQILGEKRQVIVNEYTAMIVTVYNRLAYLHDQFEWLAQLLEEIGWHKALWNEDTSRSKIVRDMRSAIATAKDAGVLSFQWIEIKSGVISTDAFSCNMLDSSQSQVGIINSTYNLSSTSFDTVLS